MFLKQPIAMQIVEFCGVYSLLTLDWEVFGNQLGAAHRKRERFREVSYGNKRRSRILTQWAKKRNWVVAESVLA